MVDSVEAQMGRGIVLMQQNRPKDAIVAFRAAIQSDPQLIDAYIYLSLCLSAHTSDSEEEERKAQEEAETVAQQAISLAPESPMTHYALGRALYMQDRYPPALEAAEMARRLDPDNEGYCALIASIHLHAERPIEALEAAEAGLEIDPEDVRCNNIRAQALTKLGRHDEAALTLGETLAKNPEDSHSHTNQGMSQLHRGAYREALESFREALRLEPNSEYARHGMLMALRAKSLVYRPLLQFFLWMSRLSGKARWGVLIGAYVLMRVLRGFAKTTPAIEPYIFPILLVYAVFVLITWVQEPLTNLVLLLHPFGRLVLNSRERQNALLFGGQVLLGAGLLGAYAWKGGILLLIFGCLTLIMILPVSASLRAQSVKNRLILGLYTIGLLSVALIGILYPPLFGTMLPLFGIGFLGFTLLGNALD